MGIFLTFVEIMTMAKTMINEELSVKQAKIEEMQKALEKQFGKGVVMGGNDKAKYHDFIPTGSLGLDKALGIGGLPKGRIVEIMGWESSGKTTIAIHTIAEAHKNPDSYCGYVDAEHSFDARYAEQIGVDLSRLKISQPDYGEQGLEVAEKMCQSGQFDVVVVDSVAALVPKAEVDREMGESSMGKHALLMSQAMRKLTPVVAKSGTILIFINQKREKIGVMFGDSSTTTGGNSLKFYASVRLDVTRSTTKDNSVMDGEVKIGNLTKVNVIKNKTAPPFRQCSFNIKYGVGIDKYEELLDLALEMNLVIKKGAHFSYLDANIAHGRQAMVTTLKEEGGMYHELLELVKDSYVPKELTIEEIKQVEKEDKNGI
jgi:recombination protein RecA